MILRNLSINGGTTVSPGVNGIRFLSGESLHVENCRIFGFSTQGLDCQPSASSSALNKLFVKDTDFQNIGTTIVGSGAILIQPNTTSSVEASLDNVTMANCRQGLSVRDSSKVTARNCMAARSLTFGFSNSTTPVAADLNLENCVTTNNGTIGINAQGAVSTVRLSNCTITNNPTGLSLASGGVIKSFGSNKNAGNATPGTPTAPNLVPQ